MSTEKLLVVAVVLILLLSTVGGLTHSDYLAAQIEIAKLECRK